MTVTFTPNQGLAKPDDTEIAREWADSDTDWWASFNKNILNDFIGNLSIQTYTPALTGSTTNPNLGSGTNVRQDGWYCILPGNFVYGGFIFTFGSSGINIGDGFYGVVLPVPADSSFHTLSGGAAGVGDVLGEGSIRDDSSATTSQTFAVELLSTSVIRLYTENTVTSRWVTHNVPFTWAANDSFNGSFFYKRS